MQWQTSPGLTDYAQAVAFMEARAAAIRAGEADELVWLVEHPPLYTAGSGAKASGLLDASRLPVYETGRGGEYTYHGPGQRVAYVMLDLQQRGKDLRRYVQQLEQWLIQTLATFGVEGFTREGRIGVWVNIPQAVCRSQEVPSRRSADQSGVQLTSEAKIAAIGIRVRQWVSYHGIALNVAPDLSHYEGIVPCGISDYGVTSLQQLGVDASMQEVDAALRECFETVFAFPHAAVSSI